MDEVEIFGIVKGAILCLFMSRCNQFCFKRRRITENKFYMNLLTINAPVVFMARYVMVLRGATKNVSYIDF